MRNMFLVAVWTIIILVTCALLMGSLDPVHRVALLLASAAVGCVYVACESRVRRAHAPLILRDETAPEKSKPPEPAE